MITVTKDQLRQLQEHRGQFDRDSGRVFEGVAGARNPRTGLWELETKFRDVADGDQLDEFRLSDILTESPLAQFVASQDDEPEEPQQPSWNTECCP